MQPALSTLQRFRSWLTGHLRADDAHLSLGVRGERRARRYLRRHGIKIVGQNEKVPGGEIDLIGIDSKTVVFIEVKTRTSHDRGHPAEAVDERKQRKLTQLALSFQKRHDLLETPARFDVVAVTWSDGDSDPHIEHFKNAFEPTDRWQMFS